MDSESKGIYSQESPIKFLTSPLESSLCDYFDAYILVTGNIAVTRTTAAAGVVHHLKTVEQKLMIHFLIMQILLILQCLCTT